MLFLCSIYWTLTLHHQTLSHCPSQNTSQDMQGSTDHIPLIKQHFAELQLGLHFISGTLRNTCETGIAPTCTQVLGHRSHSCSSNTVLVKLSGHTKAPCIPWLENKDLFLMQTAVEIDRWLWGNSEKIKKRLLRVFPFTSHVERLCSLAS